MRRLVLFLVSIGVLATFSGTVSAADIPGVLFVFDASGSMHGKTGETTKFLAAKNVMRQVLPQLDPEIPAGLVVYGHRRSGDCSDIEVLVSPGSTDREAMLRKVLALEATGMTPITDALSVALDLVKLRREETTVVLVSDGEETCNADPCAVVGKLKDAGIPFVVQVVGFQVDTKARTQLECIARAGGGTYFQADDAAGLLKALRAIERQIDSKVEAARATVTPAGTGLGKIEINMPAPTTRGMAGLELVRTRDGKVVKKTERLPEHSTHPLLDGEYEVWYLFAQPNYGEPTRTKLGTVEVRRGETVVIDLGAVEFNVAEPFSKDTGLEQVIVADSVWQKPVVVVNDRGNGYYNFKPKAVMPGVYDVQLRYSNSPSSTTVARRVAVSPGKSSVVGLDSGIRLKPAESTDVTGWDLVPLGQKGAAGEAEGTRPAPGPVVQARPPYGNKSTLWMPYPVPPGKYTLIVHIKGMDEPLPVAEGLEIKSGQLLEFNTGL